MAVSIPYAIKTPLYNEKILKCRNIKIRIHSAIQHIQWDFFFILLFEIHEKTEKEEEKMGQMWDLPLLPKSSEYLTTW